MIYSSQLFEWQSRCICINPAKQKYEEENHNVSLKE